NNFGGMATVAGVNVSLNDINALTVAVTASGNTSLAAAGNLTVSGATLDLTTIAGGTSSFGATAATGNLTSSSSGAVSQTGALLVSGTSSITATGQDVTLAGANDFGGAATVAGAHISLNDINALTAVLTASGNSTLAAAGSLVVSGTTVDLSTSTTAAGTTSFGATTATGNLTSSSAGAVSQTGALTVGGNSSIDATGRNITLGGANDFGSTATVTGANINLNDINTLTVLLTASGNTNLAAAGNLAVSGTTLDLSTSAGGTSSFGATTASGNLTSSSAGVVSQTGALTVGGTSHIAAAGQDVDLRLGNDFAGSVNVGGANVGLSDSNDLTVAITATRTGLVSAGGVLMLSGSAAGALTSRSGSSTNFGATTVGLALTATAGSDLTQTGALDVGGTATLNSTAASIRLGNIGNDFKGSVSAIASGPAQSVTLVDANALDVSLTAGGAGSAAALAGALTLSSASTGTTLSTNSSAGTRLGATTVGSALTVVAGGDVTQTGPITVGSTAAINSGAGSITLADASNDFQGLLTATAASTNQSVTVVDANSLNAQLTASGVASATAKTGALALAGSIGGSLTTHSAGNTDFGATTVGASLTSSAGTDIGQTGALVVATAASLNAAAGNITVNHADNDFVGLLTATAAAAGKDVSIVDANMLNLNLRAGRAGRASASTGDLDITATTGTTLTTHSGGASNFGASHIGSALTATAATDLTQTGALTVATTATLSATAGAISLADANNDFQAAVTATAAKNLSLVDANQLRLSLAAGGSATVKAGDVLTLNGSAGTDLSLVGGSTTSLGATLAGGILSVNSTGALSQTGAITASGLELKGEGSVKLDNPANQVSLIAASGGSGGAAIEYVNAGNLAVGAVNSLGLTRSGRVSLRSVSGDLTLNQSVDIGTAELTLQSQGQVGQALGQSIKAGGLELLGAATFTLKDVGNDVSRIAVASGGAADGVVSYVDANALVVDEVGGTSGIARTGHVTLSNLSGAMTLNQAVNLGAANLTLRTGGSVTQAAGKTITATGLELGGSGSFTLTDSGNQVAKIAATSGGAGDGALRYVDADALTLGTVEGSVGISRSGDVSLRNQSGDLSLSQSALLAGKALRLEAVAGAVLQTSGRIDAAALGVNAANSISLGQTNAVASTFAARSNSGDILFKNGNGYAVGNLSADGTPFTAVNGLTVAATNNITLNTGAGTVTQAAGSNLTAGGLELLGSGAYTLTNPANDIAKFAAAQGAASDGAIAYVDANGFELSSVGAVGVTRAGTVDLSNDAGSLSLVPLAGSIVSISGGAIGIASPQLVDGKLSLPVFNLSGNIALDKGALSLKVLKAANVDAEMFAKYRSDIGIAKEVILVDAVGRPIKILADVIVQSAGSLKVANEGRLNLLAELGGSASLQQAGNDFSGGLSANLAAVKPAASEEGPARSLLRVVGTTVNVVGDGVSADTAYLAAEQLATGDAAAINVRMSYSNTLGTRSQMPALVLDMASNAFDGSVSNPFGSHPGANIRVTAGADGAQGQAEAGFVSVRPNATLDPVRTQSLIGKRAAIFLSGPETGVAGYLFFYDGAGSQLEIPIYYNGYAPSSPQVEGALSSIASVSEAARRDRFEEAVRTENVAARLRGGVISEVGPGRPATSGSSGAAEAAGCEMVGGEAKESQLKCKI
ncbi:hypothetical protein, partial [Roseateles sp.]|uniref:beta strand repeat-containing protein n=1 Tax=Roseateles sp. TaxID=1971397 RepID=UPI00286B8FF4